MVFKLSSKLLQGDCWGLDDEVCRVNLIKRVVIGFAHEIDMETEFEVAQTN